VVGLLPLFTACGPAQDLVAHFLNN